MDPKRVVICRCEDVTLYDVLQVLKDGITDIENLRRRLRIGMGPCQGRYCIPLLLKILSRELKVKITNLPYPKVRPPLTPIQIKYFVRG